MARKHKHEDHLNHEAWAIPYGDLMTLLLAFFVVMYAVSSVNEGRYRVLADSLSQAFGGPPKSMQPVQIGDKPVKGHDASAPLASPMQGYKGEPSQLAAQLDDGAGKGRAQLMQMAAQVEAALKGLIDTGAVVVRRHDSWLEIEMRTDILFPSGSARLSPAAEPVLRKLANVLAPFEQALRIEGHTDNVPIATSIYPSNWELSAARAASVVHLLMQSGLPPSRMSVAGFGEYRPVGDNHSVEGRNQNRRVVIVAMANNSDGDALKQASTALDAPPPPSPSVATLPSAPAPGVHEPMP